MLCVEKTPPLEELHLLWKDCCKSDGDNAGQLLDILIRGFENMDVNITATQKMWFRYSSRTKSGSDAEEFLVSRFKPTVYQLLLDELSGESIDSTLFPCLNAVSQTVDPSHATSLLEIAEKSFGPGKHFKFTHFLPMWSQTDQDKESNYLRNGPRIIVFLLGGVTIGECRSAYQLSEKFSRSVLIGSSGIITPAAYVDAILDMDHPFISNSIVRQHCEPPLPLNSKKNMKERKGNGVFGILESENKTTHIEPAFAIKPRTSSFQSTTPTLEAPSNDSVKSFSDVKPTLSENTAKSTGLFSSLENFTVGLCGYKNISGAFLNTSNSTEDIVLPINLSGNSLGVAAESSCKDSLKKENINLEEESMNSFGNDKETDSNLNLKLSTKTDMDSIHSGILEAGVSKQQKQSEPVINNNPSIPLHSCFKPLPSTPDELMIAHLMEMGYSRAKASIALSMSKNLIPDALDYLNLSDKIVDTPSLQGGLIRPSGINSRLIMIATSSLTYVSSSSKSSDSPNSKISTKKFDSRTSHPNIINQPALESVEKLRQNIDALLSLTSDDDAPSHPSVHQILPFQHDGKVCPQVVIQDDFAQRHSADRSPSLYSSNSIDSGNSPVYMAAKPFKSLPQQQHQPIKTYAYKPFDQPYQESPPQSYRPIPTKQSQQPRPYAYKPFDNQLPPRPSSPSSIKSQESSDLGRRNFISSESRPYPQQFSQQVIRPPAHFHPMPRFYRPPSQFMPVNTQFERPQTDYAPLAPYGPVPVWQGSQNLSRPAPGQPISQSVYRPLGFQPQIVLRPVISGHFQPRPVGQPLQRPPLPRGQVIYRGPPLTAEQIAALQQQYGVGNRPR